MLNAVLRSKPHVLPLKHRRKPSGTPHHWKLPALLNSQQRPRLLFQRQRPRRRQLHSQRRHPRQLPPRPRSRRQPRRRLRPRRRHTRARIARSGRPWCWTGYGREMSITTILSPANWYLTIPGSPRSGHMVCVLPHSRLEHSVDLWLHGMPQWVQGKGSYCPVRTSMSDCRLTVNADTTDESTINLTYAVHVPHIPWQIYLGCDGFLYRIGD